MFLEGINVAGTRAAYYFFFPARTFAHRALCAAEMRARPAAEIFLVSPPELRVPKSFNNTTARLTWCSCRSRRCCSDFNSAKTRFRFCIFALSGKPIIAVCRSRASFELIVRVRRKVQAELTNHRPHTARHSSLNSITSNASTWPSL